MKDKFIDCRQRPELDSLLKNYRKYRFAIRNRLQEFQNIKAGEYFYELVYCLLTPQTSAFSADKAIRVLKKNQFHKRKINPEKFLYHKEYYIRFHKTKAKNLIDMKDKFPLINEQLQNGLPPIVLREWLIKNVKGLGHKEASHFLRNIGYRNLAILDRHILKNLVKVGVIDGIPTTLSKKIYYEIEAKFQEFSESIKIPMDELDLLFWCMETGEVFK